MKRMTLTVGLVWAVLAVLSITAAARAQQTTIPDYETARDGFFYRHLYNKGGFTLYCGAWFPVEIRNGQVHKSLGLNVEHVYPASWMKETAGCPGQTRQQCRDSSQAFNFMEADLHNLYPAISFVNQARSNFPFAVIPGEDHSYEGCDFEHDGDADLAEPRPAARGNIARAVFYMHRAYGLPVTPELGALLLQWHLDDPVSKRERWRNDKIEGLQGTRNPFIDDPNLAGTLSF
jgi:deoxyribonuclease-1